MTDAQAELMIGLLTEIRDALVPPQAVGDDQAPCEHPEDRRVDLRSFGDRDHWVCKDCKFEHKGLN